MQAIVEALSEEHHNIARLLLVLEHQIEIFASAEMPDADVMIGVGDYRLD